MATYQFKPNPDIGPANKFVWADCNRAHRCNPKRDFEVATNVPIEESVRNMHWASDPVAYLVEEYQNEEISYYHGVKGVDGYAGCPCIDIKWSMADCLSGCHNKHYHADQKSHTAPHQRRLHIITKAILPGIIENEEFDSSQIRTFEDLYAWLERSFDKYREKNALSQYKNDRYPKQIHIYDAAVRIGRNMKYSYGREVAPKDFVYLHCGAYDGAKAILAIQKALNKEYIKLDSPLERDSRVSIGAFNAVLKILGSWHLENFLCCKHEALEKYSKELKQSIKTKQK